MIKTYGGDQEQFSMGHGKIEIAGVVLQPDDVMKLNKIIDGQYQVQGQTIEETATNIAQKTVDVNAPAIDQKLVL